MLTIEINQRTDVTLEHAYRVWQTGEDVRFSSDAIDTMRVGKAAFEAFVHSDRTQLIYGTTNAPAAHAKNRLSVDAQTAQVRSLRASVPIRAATTSSSYETIDCVYTSG